MIFTEQDAKNELQLYQQILENLAEGVYLVKAADLTIVYTNPTFEQMFGYEPGELLGQHVGIINAPADVDPKEVALMIEAELKSSGVWSGDVNNQKKDGTPFWCHVNISSFDHPQFGSVWLSIQQDVTAIRNAEKEKEEIYYATIYGAQHITNNLLNQLILIELEVEKHPDFDKKKLDMLETMKRETSELLEKLSSVKQIDAKVIKESIYPK